MSSFRQTVWYKLLLYVCGGAVALCALLIATKSPYAAQAAAVGAAALLVLGLHVVAQATAKIDVRLARELGVRSLKGLHVYSKSFPGYRFVDVYRAAERFCQRHGPATVVDTQHNEDLNSIVNSQFYGDQSGKVRAPTQMPKEVACDTEEFFPGDRFWVLKRNRSASGGSPPSAADDGDAVSAEAALCEVAILRVRVLEYTGEVALEMAAFRSDAAERATAEIVEDSIAKSIYRYQLLQISFDSGVKDEYGDVETSGPFSLLFKQRRTVSSEQIILDDDVREMLRRNVFDFHRRREQLRRYGVPTKKGILFYGPPGTGKTYTCQYIYSNLEQVTTMVVTGQSLLHVKTICNLARMLQPTLLVLEDVDLIFSSREINLYSTALGDFMDELDGFQNDEPVTYLLTTNAIDRLEQAIKDRPGRINQCIYFGPPNSRLRKLYIERYLQGYDYAQLDLDEVVSETRGTTQAFLKELIYRAVQIALEDAERHPYQQHGLRRESGHPPDGNNSTLTGRPYSSNGEMVSLRNADFTAALEEMTKFSEKATGSIMGFRVEQ